MKAYGIDINPRMIQYNAAIRQKGDVARLLVNIVRFLNVFCGLFFACLQKKKTEKWK